MLSDVECHFVRQSGADAWEFAWYRRTPTRIEAAKAVEGKMLLWDQIDEGVYTQPPLVLSGQEFQALRKAMVEQYDPPSESKALREALALERQRVDKILEVRLDD